MTIERICAAPGCDHSMEGRSTRATYCSPACRAAAFRVRHGIVPVSQRQERANAPRRRGGASGLQVSYRKAIEAVALVYRAEGLPQDAATEIAELALDPALSPTQRARLEQMRSRGRG